MRFETISDTDLLRYALIGMRQAEPQDDEEAYLLEEQINEVEESLDTLTKDMRIGSVKKLKIGEKFGDWYYQKFEDEENECTVYNLYDSSGEYINEFNGLGDIREYIHRLYSRKGS